MPVKDFQVVKPGDKVSYEDMANPYREYLVVATPDDLPNEWGYKEFRVQDENGSTRTVTLGQHGWNHHPKLTR